MNNPSHQSHAHCLVLQTNTCQRVLLFNLVTDRQTDEEKETIRVNSRLAKVPVQCSADTFLVNQNWISVSTFVVKISTFARPNKFPGATLE
jgi:hypothetical protein